MFECLFYGTTNHVFTVGMGCKPTEVEKNTQIYKNYLLYLQVIFMFCFTH